MICQFGALHLNSSMTANMALHKRMESLVFLRSHWQMKDNVDLEPGKFI